MMIAWWLLIAAVVVLVVRSLGRSGRAPAAPAEDALADRFARGEIDEQEFRARLAVLKERR
jgi:putative membrane protein